MKTACIPLVACVVLGLWAAPAATTGKDEMKGKEMLILGFERQEIAEKTRRLWGGVRDGSGGMKVWAWFETDNPDLSKPTVGNKLWEWTIVPDGRDPGGLALTGPLLPVDGKCRTPFQSTELIDRFYPVPTRERSGQTQLIFNTFQWLRAAPAELRDWSGYSRLLLDVKVDTPARLRVFIEDDFIEPPVVAAYDVPAGEWVTLELDLARAQRQRRLNTKEMVNLWIAANVAADGRFWLDNIRVAAGAVKGAHKVLRCEESFALPARSLPRRPVMPDRPADFKPDRAALTPAAAAQVDIGAGRLAPFGWVSAGDNQRLFLAVGKPPRALYTLDGGRTWKQADAPVVVNEDHGTARGFALDDFGDGAAVSSGPGCAGMGVATPRQFMTKYTFTGGGWAARLPATIVDCDIRHCGSTMSMLRVRSGPRKGRLWAAWGEVDRRRTLAIHAKSSDDDGATWHAWGLGARVPGSREGDWATNTYGYQQVRITEYDGHVACFWQDQRGLLWAHFDGERWSPVTAIDGEARAPLAVAPSESFRVPGSAVTLGEGEIFLTAWNVPGVLHWTDKGWKRELSEACDAGTLSVCGDQVMLFTTGHVPQPPPQKQVRIFRSTPILCYRRTPAGKWLGPFNLAPGGAVRLLQYRQITSFVAPPVAPPNFVPAAWSDEKDRVWLVRVPADIEAPLPGADGK